jgi:hypothetical protein
LILPLEKYTFYCNRFTLWASMDSLSLEDVESALGISMYLSEVVQCGSAYCAVLVALKARGRAKWARVSKEKGSIPADKITMHIQPQVKEFFLFWVPFLNSWNRIAPMMQRFGPRGDAQIRVWVDSSPGTTSNPPGVGGVLFDPCLKRLLGYHWLFPEDQKDLFIKVLSSGLKEKNAPVCEALGLAQVMLVFATYCYRKRLLVETDSETVMLAYRKAFSVCSGLRTPLRQTRLLCARSCICLRVRSMLRTFPPIRICDLLSRGQIADAKSLALQTFGVALHML